MRHLGQRVKLLGYYQAALVVFLAGCAESSTDVVPVHGKVTLNGAPLTTGRVMTMPPAGRGAGGEIQPDGTFELTTYTEGDGALPGTHQVAVRAYDNTSVTDPETSVGESLIPTRYGNPTASGLTIEVLAGEENSPTLQLTSP